MSDTIRPELKGLKGGMVSRSLHGWAECSPIEENPWERDLCLWGLYCGHPAQRQQVEKLKLIASVYSGFHEADVYLNLGSRTADELTQGWSDHLASGRLRRSPVPSDAIILDRQTFAAFLDRLSALEKAVEQQQLLAHSSTDVPGRLRNSFAGVKALAEEVFGECTVVRIVPDDDSESGHRIRVSVLVADPSEFSVRRREWHDRIIAEFSALLPGDLSLDLRFSNEGE